MGKNRKRAQTNHTHSRTIWKGVEREVKRREIDKASQEAAAAKADPVPSEDKGNSNGERTECERDGARSSD